MTQQLELPIQTLGQQLRPRLDESVQRMLKSKHIKQPGDHFYCAEFISGTVHIWSGRGQTPQWVKGWLESGGLLDDLRAIA